MDKLNISPEEILNSVIDEYYKIVPNNVRNDFARKIKNTQYECALLAMAKYTEYFQKQLEEENKVTNYERKVAYDTSKANANLIVKNEELKYQNNLLVEVVKEAITQLKYLDERFPTGTTPAIISQLETKLFNLKLKV